MKILLAGDWHSEIYEKPLMFGLNELGVSVDKFAWHTYFMSKNKMRSFIAKAQNKFLLGPLITKVNRDLFELVRTSRPDVLFVFRGSHIYQQTLELIRKEVPRVKIIGYNNDDPFAPKYPIWVWRIFKQAIPSYDLMYAYRHHNIDDFYRAGSRQVKLLRSWYFSEYNYPLNLTAEQRAMYGCDITFIGHFEEDGRIDYIAELINSPYKFRLYGPEWAGYLNKHPALNKLPPIRPVRGPEYNLALNGATVALCFLSKLNRDTYTRRCFEIPASGAIMLAEYTEDLAAMFEPDREAFYFRTKEELLFQLSRILSDCNLVSRVREAAKMRLLNDGHDALSRAKQILDDIAIIP